MKRYKEVRVKDEELYKNLRAVGYSHRFSDSVSNVIVETGRRYDNKPVKSEKRLVGAEEPVEFLSKHWWELYNSYE